MSRHAVGRAVSRMTIGYSIFVLAILLLRPILERLNGIVAFALNFTPLLVLPAAILCLLALPFSRRAAVVALVPVLLTFAPYAKWVFRQTVQMTAAAAAGETLTILTHNISNKSYAMGDQSEFLEQQDADVITLQEVHYGARRQDRILELLSSSYPYSQIQMLPDSVDANLTLSRYPIIASEPLDELGTLYTRLCVDGWALDVYNVSLDTPIRDDDRGITGVSLFDLALKYDSARRDEQVDALVERLDTQTDPLIVAGDFNLGDQTTRYGALAQSLGDSYAEVGDGLGLTWPLGGTPGFPLPGYVQPIIRIDYIWHSASFHAVSAETLRGTQSDHLAVRAELGWDADVAPVACAVP